MSEIGTVIRNGTVIDGTGAAVSRRCCDRR
jgi:hypothetical protein